MSCAYCFAPTGCSARRRWSPPRRMRLRETTAPEARASPPFRTPYRFAPAVTATTVIAAAPIRNHTSAAGMSLTSRYRADAATIHALVIPSAHRTYHGKSNTYARHRDRPVFRMRAIILETRRCARTPDALRRLRRTRAKDAPRCNERQKDCNWHDDERYARGRRSATMSNGAACQRVRRVCGQDDRSGDNCARSSPVAIGVRPF
jgi:hypothetical protein